MTRMIIVIATAAWLASCSGEAEPAATPTEEPALAPGAIRIEASDGTQLVGDLRHGQTADAPLVVLVHQLSTDRSEWASLRDALGDRFTTFAYDMRGHGESTRRGDTTLDWESFEPSDWRSAAGDVQTVLTALLVRDDVSPNQIGLVGSSIGSSEVIFAAPEVEMVHAVVALSPGRAYRELAILEPAGRFEDRALLAIAASGEAPSVETLAALAAVVPDGRTLTVSGSDHGVSMFVSAPESLPRVVAFLSEELLGAEP